MTATCLFGYRQLGSRSIIDVFEVGVRSGIPTEGRPVGGIGCALDDLDNLIEDLLLLVLAFAHGMLPCLQTRAACVTW